MEKTIITKVAWADEIPNEKWAVWERVLKLAQERGIRFALGGSFSIATYTGKWRATKDLDIYVLPSDADAMVSVVAECGLGDYYTEAPYDRQWIFRAFNEFTIVDVIWAMANHRAQVDEPWVERGPDIEVRGMVLRVIPAEEVVWDKLYIMQKDRCDWPDVLNVLYSAGPGLDWHYLLDRVAGERLLLAGAMCVFRWACPGRAQEIPEWVWDRLNIPAPDAPDEPDADLRRIRLLDSRFWFRGIDLRLQAA